MRARYAGVCSRTGRHYSAGTEIVKSNGGWAIAGAATPATEIRWVRTADGELKQANVNLPGYCGGCMKAAGIEREKGPKQDWESCRMDRKGDDYVCPRCGRTSHILSDAEVWTEITLPDLYIERVENSYSKGHLSLSRKVGPAMWEKIKQYFSYITAEDFDDRDEFEMPSGWYVGRRDVETVEEILGILPENRFEVREERLKAESEEADRKAAERREVIARLDAAFDRDAGEYVRPEGGGQITVEGEKIDHPRGGGNIYGGGEWFVLDDDGRHIWRVRNNGMDGDDWSQNNVRTGGAGGIGYRFEATPDRLDLLRQACPDRMAEIAADKSGREAEKQLLTHYRGGARFEIYRFEHTKDLNWTEVLRVKNKIYEAADHPNGILLRSHKVTEDPALSSIYAEMRAFDAGVRAEIASRIAIAGEARVAQTVLLDAAWRGDHDLVLQRAAEMDGLERWTRVAQQEPYRVTRIEEMPGAVCGEAASMLKDAGVEIVLMTRVGYADLGVKPEAFDAYVRSIAHADRFAPVAPYRDPAGDLFAQVMFHGWTPTAWVKAGEPGPAWIEAGEAAIAQRENEAAQRELKRLRDRLVKSQIADADQITGRTIGEELDRWERSSHSGGAECSIHGATLHTPAGHRPVYSVQWSWGYRGAGDADADSGEDFYEDLAAAKAGFASFRATHS